MAEAFERVKDQIGYCGIWCGSCVVGNGTMAELTKRYEELAHAYGLELWAPEDLDVEQFMRGLRSIQGVSECRGCREGGGRDDCPLRICAIAREIVGCHVCPEAETCEHRADRDHMRSGALKAGLFVNTEDVDTRQLIDQWTAELKSKWPCCILFNGTS